jgi:uncharacterized protein YggE
MTSSRSAASGACADWGSFHRRLSAKQVSPNDIESFTVYKRILTNENGDKSLATIRGYDVSRSLKFTARKLDSLPAIEESLVGSANVENITCQFDRTDRAAIEAELLAKAIQSARSQADKLAEPLGRRYGERVVQNGVRTARARVSAACSHTSA